MAKVQLYDHAMGSPSGIGLNSELPQKELLRVATLLYYLEQQGIEVSRANMSTYPQAFLQKEELMDKLMEEGDTFLPVWYDEHGLWVSGRYPSNEEVAEHYALPALKEGLPQLPDEAFNQLWQEAEAWGMCSTGSCEGCSGCG